MFHDGKEVHKSLLTIHVKYLLPVTAINDTVRDQVIQDFHQFTSCNKPDDFSLEAVHDKNEILICPLVVVNCVSRRIILQWA